MLIIFPFLLLNTSHYVKEKRNILHTKIWRKVKWIGHSFLCNCLLKHVIEGKIEGTRRRKRRHKQLFDDTHETCTSSQSLENSFCKKLWTFLKKECVVMVRDLSSPFAGNGTWIWPFTAAFKGSCKIPAYYNKLPAKFPHETPLAFQLNWWNFLTHEQQQKPLFLSLSAFTRAWHAHKQQSYLTIVSLNCSHWTCNALNPLSSTLILHVAFHHINFIKLHFRKRCTCNLAWNLIFKMKPNNTQAPLQKLTESPLTCAQWTRTLLYLVPPNTWPDTYTK